MKRTYIFTACPIARLLYTMDQPFPDGTIVTKGNPSHLPTLSSRNSGQVWITANGGKSWALAERHELKPA